MIWGQIRIVGPDGSLTPQGIQMLQSLETSSGGSVAWGGITGTLGDQGDLATELAGKQDTLVSGTTIKTVNGASVLGSGDLAVGAAWGSISGTLSAQTDLQAELDLIPTTGSAVVTVPNGAMEFTGTVTAAGVTSGMNVLLTLGADTAENSAELLDIAGLSGTAGTGQISVSMAFLAPVAGDIRINWSAA